jgi:tRNA(Ile2) C34 agmatinyltransferase TiaS
MRTAPLFVMLLLALVAAPGCNKPRPASAKDEPMEPVAKLTTEELLAEYQKNEVGADQKYKDKLIQLTGTVSEVQKDIVGRYYVGLGAPQENEMFDVMCYLDKSAFEDAGKLKKGDKVTLKGLCQGRTLKVLNLKTCVIVK